MSKKHRTVSTKHRQVSKSIEHVSKNIEKWKGDVYESRDLFNMGVFQRFGNTVMPAGVYECILGYICEFGII